jgi:hypothetical protein
MTGMRNAMWLDKSKHTGVMGMSWCTATGWNAVATDLVLGRTREYECGKYMASLLAGVGHCVSLCYDKGIPSLRAHLVNLNHVYIPCFLSADKEYKYTSAEGSRNRAIAENRYVVEMTYSRVKAWRMLQPIAPREEFYLLNSVWWWALGFSFQLPTRPGYL